MPGRRRRLLRPSRLGLFVGLRTVVGFRSRRPEGDLGAVRMPLVGRPGQVHHPGMVVVRALLLVVVAVLFVTTVSLVFLRDTGPVEKVVLAGVAVLLAVLVPRIQRLGRPALP
jgi:hypothetical protein